MTTVDRKKKEDVVRVLGLVFLSIMIVGCQSTRSGTGASSFEPLLVPTQAVEMGPLPPRPTFRIVPAEPVTVEDILPLPPPDSPSDMANQSEAYVWPEAAAGEWRVLPLVRFSYDSWVLTPEAKGILREAGSWLRGFIPGPLSISGHADARGTEAYNQALGYKRAQAVVTYLRSLGIHEESMHPVTYGELQPVCVEASEECYATNRRAVVIVEQKRGPALLSGLYTFPSAAGDGHRTGTNDE